jgi:hypothetical protein
MFQISDQDLAILERAIPVLHELCSNLPEGYFRPDVQIAIEECKRILSDVRWNYGPYQKIERAKGNDLEMED